MSDPKIRKAINVSLQSKKYADTINEIVQEWEDENLNISSETCEALLLVHRLKKLSALSNIFNIVKMLDNLSTIYHYNDEDINNMLEQIIDIDNERFSQILIELNNLQFVTSDKSKKEKLKKKVQNTQINDKIKEKEVEETSKKVVIEEENKEEVNEEPTETVSLDIDDVSGPSVPFDFLMNS